MNSIYISTFVCAISKLVDFRRHKFHFVLEKDFVTCQIPKFVIIHVLQMETEAEEEHPKDDFIKNRSQEICVHVFPSRDSLAEILSRHKR